MPVQFDLRENPAAGVKGCLRNCVLCPYPHKKCLVAERGMAERKRTWRWRMWPRGVEKQREPWGDREEDEKAVAEQAYPASYNVLLTRLATMFLLTVFVTAATLLTFVFVRTSSVDTVNILGYGLRRELLNRAADQVLNLLATQNQSSGSFSRAMDRWWLMSPEDYTTLTRTDNEIVGTWLLNWDSITGAGVCAASGIYRYDYITTDTGSNTTRYQAIFSNATSPPHVPPVTYQEELDVNTWQPKRPPTIFPTVNDCREKPYYLNAQNSPTGRGVTLFNAVATGAPTLIASHNIGTGEKGVVTITMELTFISRFLAGLDLLKGTMYITNGATLIASSDGYVGYQSNVSSVILASDSSNPTIRASARYLGALDAAAAVNSSRDVMIEGVTYFMDTELIMTGELNFTIVMLVPRSSVMGAIDRKFTLTIATVISGSGGIGIIGCFLVLLLTSPVSEEIKLKRELILQLQATQKAEARNETKSRFLANMSHELRSPMASIIGLLDLLLDDDLTSPQRGNVTQIRECASGLLGLLNDLLDISKIEAGKMTLETTEFDLVGLLENLVDIMSVQSAKKGVELALDLPDGIFGRIVTGDPARVRQIFTNLINNAIKFTSEGYVLLRCRSDPSRIGWAIFEIEDSGCGIPKNRALSVFESFVQADQSTTRLYGGTGLGLTIVKSLVELMGGTIKIEEKDTPGALFRVRLCLQGQDLKALEPIQHTVPAASPGPPSGVPLVLNLRETSFQVPGKYRRSSRTQTLNYLDLDRPEVAKLGDDVIERRARAHRIERRMSPLGGARAELRAGALTLEALAMLRRLQGKAAEPESVPATVPLTLSRASAPGAHETPTRVRALTRSVTTPRGEMMASLEAFYRSMSVTRGSLAWGPRGLVPLPVAEPPKPSAPAVRSRVLLAIKGRMNEQIAARFFRDRGAAVIAVQSWGQALAHLRHGRGHVSGGSEPTESRSSSGRSVGGDDREGGTKRRRGTPPTSPRAQSQLVLENSGEAASESPKKRSSSAFRRSLDIFKRSSTTSVSSTESARISEAEPSPAKPAKDAGDRFFDLVLFDVALMPCALSDAEMVERLLGEVRSLMGEIEAAVERKTGNPSSVEDPLSCESTEEAPGLSPPVSANEENGPVKVPHLVWLLGSETPAIVRRLLRDASFADVMQKPVYVSRLQALWGTFSADVSDPPRRRELRCAKPANIAQLSISIPEEVPRVETPPRSLDFPRLQISESFSPRESPQGTPVHSNPVMVQFCAANYRVLVAEDTPVLRQLAKAVLTKMCASVTSVENGRQAVGAVLAANFGESAEGVEAAGDVSRPFDLVLMDCQMPVMDGYAAVRAIRRAEAARAAGRRLPIFALTAHAMAEDEAKCLEAGMDRYLTKPLERVKLAETMRAVLTEQSSEISPG
ncbi:hypothetical protein KFL_000260290 [Klebsormidium nitens]|uniref:histidine kinase n=1 Tax=Klebsormidium nitens TaxID=105231 RepID=A0A1Y1HMI0_KLENI|nr:hypothetical protein KFL_000260290 [Klebsormidium nitens]|eukprot:GAQ79213.1 hypothetical protein KFL_000260290 [Klebsormidium nitens]